MRRPSVVHMAYAFWRSRVSCSAACQAGAGRLLRDGVAVIVHRMRYLLALFAALCMSGAPLCAAEKWEKWIYRATNLLVDKNVDELGELLQRGKAAGYTHMLLADSKFSRLEEMFDRYFKNVERAKQLAAQHGIEIVPAIFSIGYSNDLLSRDPNLIEALPVKGVPLVVKGGIAMVDPADAPVLPGGSFDDRKKWSWADETVVFENGTARVTDPQGKLARVSRKVTVQPWRQYHVSVRVKTQEFRGKPEIKALPEKGAALCWDDLRVKPTQDWQTHHVVFNSQENTSVGLYFGVWDGSTGSLWWDDAKIEQVAFLNMPRRPGCPLLIVREHADSAALAEGVDFEPLRDAGLGTNPYAGEYDVWHEPPQLKTKLPDGTKLRASYYHGATIHEGQAMICPSEPKTVALLRDQAQRMHKLWGAKGYMMSHDEIRVLNHCGACRARNLTPGQIVADNAKTCVEILKEVNPGGRIYVWSDMFDPHHNAVAKDYYLVNGSLLNSWEGLSKDVIILPWYFSKRAESLKFFSERGHRQIIAGYYDAQPEQIKEWLAAGKGMPGILGAMYTTWQNKYGDLETFSKAIDAAGKP
jgi:hypothetical protein